MPAATDNLMPDILVMDCVYWTFTGDDDFGNPVYGEPEQIKCRWEDTQQQYVSRTGEVTVSSALVYVDRDMKLDDVLWNGNFATIVDMEKPFRNPGAKQVQEWMKLPNLDGDLFIRSVHL